MADNDLEGCLVRLLEQRSQSALGRAVWHGLLGLRANLDAELESAAADEASRETAVALRQKLQSLLGTEAIVSAILSAHPADSEPPLQFHDDIPTAVPVATPSTDELASRIQETLKNSKELPRLQPAHGLEQVWKQYQLVSLCISRFAREKLDQAIAEVAAKYAASIRPVPEEASQIDAVFCDPSQAVLAPGLQAAGQVIPALVGKCPSPAPEDGVKRANDRFEALGNAAMRWVEWAVPLVDFQHGLFELSRFGLRRLDDSREKQKFIRAAVSRVNEMKQATDAQSRFKTALGVDEIFRSLFLIPTPPPDSWWGLQLQASFDLLIELALNAKEQRGNPRRLSGRYTEVCSSSTGDIGIPAAEYGATPGQVAWCLRPWAQCGGSNLPGRVVYFSEG